MIGKASIRLMFVDTLGFNLLFVKGLAEIKK